MMRIIKEFMKGISNENPVFRLMLGLCPVLATSSSVNNALGMGSAVIFVLFCSNLIVSLIAPYVPGKIRIPIYISVIATFVSIVEMMMAAFLPALNKSLGLFIPLIVVNCIILGRAEAFASKNNPFYAIIDALGMGIGFTLSLTFIATFREILGNGTFMGHPVFGAQFEPVLVMIMAPGAFMTIGFLIAGFNWLENKKKLN